MRIKNPSRVTERCPQAQPKKHNAKKGGKIGHCIIFMAHQVAWPNFMTPLRTKLLNQLCVDLGKKLANSPIIPGAINISPKTLSVRNASSQAISAHTC